MIGDVGKAGAEQPVALLQRTRRWWGFQASIRETIGIASAMMSRDLVEPRIEILS